MAKKLVKRVEKRQRKERRATFLWKWIHACNWKATIWNRRWVGKGFNPDYTLACVTTGACSCFGNTHPCTSNPNCINANTCGAARQASLANSHQVSSGCTFGFGGCLCDTGDTEMCYSGKICKCTVFGTCAYDCDIGYSWNGVACVAGGVARRVREKIIGGGVYVEDRP